MKLFKSLIGLLPLVSALEKFNTTDVIARGRDRDSEMVAWRFDGEESSDDMMTVLYDIVGDQVDELDEAIRAFMGINGQDRFLSPGQTRKFRNLKVLVLWLQIADQFGRYCYYGCYCLPEGSHNIAAGGYGKPIDNIDRACFDFKQCYRCLIDEHKDGEGMPKNAPMATEEYDGKCRGEALGYKFDLLMKPNGKKSIKCLNKPGTCKRNICECDRHLAEALAMHESEWDETLHAVRGGFKREDQCFKQANPHRFEECCGDRYTFPFNKPRKDNQCCEVDAGSNQLGSALKLGDAKC